MNKTSGFAGFMQLNGRKSAFLVFAIVGTFVSLFSIELVLGKDDVSFPMREKMGWLAGVFVSSLCICCIALAKEYFFFLKRRSLFLDADFSAFLKARNFSSVRVYEHRKWKFTQECQTGYIGQYPVVIDISDKKKSDVVFSFRLQMMQIPKEKLNRIIDELLPYGALLGWECINVVMKKKDAVSFSHVDNTLAGVAMLLETEGFIPAKKPDFDKINLTAY